MKSSISFRLLLGVIMFTQISGSIAQNIRVNQIGYYPTEQKIAAVPGTQTGSFYLINTSTGQTAYTGTLPNMAQTWSASGESIKFADFSSFTTVGTYYVKTGSETSQVFDIKSSNTYESALTWVAKGFYLWRASTAITATNATYNGTSYARSAGHADNSVIIHSSAATSQRPEGTIVSAPKGWYDAGDYNLYVINAGVSVFMMAHAYELYPTYFASLNLNIPESSNSTPDILDEIKWEMDWLLAMQDLDGGVYFKLTSKWFDSFEMPSADVLPRYMVGKSTTSALDFAAMTAMAYRLFKNSTDYPGFADKCLAASEKAWTWAKNNPSITFTNPSDISTGGYTDTYYGDEFFWAASELLISTGKQSYYNELNFYLTFLSPTWSYVAGNGIMSLALHVNELPTFADKNTILSKFTTLADDNYNLYNQSTYKVPLVDFYWGSNGDMATRGALLGSAYKILNNTKYKTAAEEGLNYLLGRNALGYCFVTGFGDKYPVDIHDRRSQSDGIANSIPGYLVGGPNTDAQSDCGTSAYATTTYKAKSYLDKNCSYSTNEIAINWNAPMVALLGMTEASNNTLATITTNITAPVNNTNYCAGIAINVTATATISSGTISNVAFYDGTTLLNTDNTSPYAYTWTNASVGTHTIKAIATGSNGNTSSASVVVTVNAIPASPTVTSTVTYNQYATTTQLTATGSNLLWYTVNTGGVGATTAPAPSSANAGTSYYYVSQTVNTCESQRAQITVVINPVSKDCAGVINGTASLDACGVCSGGTTGVTACSQLEAETGTVFDGISESANTGYSGTGYVNGDNATGATLNFALNSSIAQTVLVNIRYAHNTATGRKATVSVNNNQQIASLDFPSTASLTVWDTINVSLSLSKGLNIVTFSSISTTGLANIDKVWYNQSKLSFTTIAKQNIILNAGWNLISTNQRVADSSITKLFGGLQVNEIKTMDAFWRLGQTDAFNSLKQIEPGNAYLVNMNASGTLTIIGIPVETASFATNIKTGWQLIGCPFQNSINITNYFNSTNCLRLKDFNGFWIPNGTLNSLNSIEPSKGYFIKK